MEQVAFFSIFLNSRHFNQINNSLMALCVNLCVDVRHRPVESTEWFVIWFSNKSNCQTEIYLTEIRIIL